MSQIKADFILQLQDENKPLWPNEISHKIRHQFAWMSLYKVDLELDPEHIRGYMVRIPPTRAHSAQDPHIFWCIIAGNQSMGWQNITWTKEMLQALDGDQALTTNEQQLGDMLDMGAIDQPNDDETPANVVADRNGFTLALACAVPKAYRLHLRQHLQSSDSLAPQMLADLGHIPEQYISYVLDAGFEDKFEKALDEICEGGT
ncbi:hypothetical protein [Parasphingorhabdus sp.]|uniref:hypothetical protein n=1 Tax=Parasphingorhabdus sp. TaxID=2709688 RepID=UPI003264D5BF